MEAHSIHEGLLSEIVRAARGLHGAGTLSPKVIGAVARHLGRRSIQHSIETGTGASTLLFSHLSGEHTVFALDDGIANVRSSPAFDPARTQFVVGPTQKTLPAHNFQNRIQAALLDGPHGFPFPQIEYWFIYPLLDTGALLIIDDIHIPSVHDLFRFLRADQMFELIEVAAKTAFFERTPAPAFDPLGDGWWLQGYNRRTLFRFTWKDRVKAAIPRYLRSAIQKREAFAPQVSAAPSRDSFVTISSPVKNDRVGQSCLVRGTARIPPGTRLWLLARRRDQPGWWPQGESAIDTASLEWSHPCKFGEASDVGFLFELALLVTDKSNGALLDQWLVRSKSGRAIAPLPLPPHAPGCPPVMVMVRKTEHGAHTTP